MAKEPKIEITAEIEEGLPELTDAEKIAARKERAAIMEETKAKLLAKFDADILKLIEEEMILRANGA